MFCPFFLNLQSVVKDNDPELAPVHVEENKMVHIVSWMDCLDLRSLAILANSTLSSSRFVPITHKSHRFYILANSTLSSSRFVYITHINLNTSTKMLAHAGLELSPIAH